MGYSVYKSDSIFVPVVLHFLNNFIAIIAFFVFGKEELIQSNFEVEKIETHTISFILLLALFIGFVIFISRNYNKLTNKEVQNDLSEV